MDGVGALEETEVSSISDEIRTWCDGVGTVNDLRALADRIRKLAKRED